MTMEHLTDKQIQELVFENGQVPDLISHIDQCGACKKRSEEYKTLFKAANFERAFSPEAISTALIMQNILNNESKAKASKSAVKFWTVFILLFAAAGFLYYPELHTENASSGTTGTFLVFIVGAFMLYLHLLDDINSYFSKRKALLR